jgi:phosphoserine phosphatase RsbU/P
MGYCSTHERPPYFRSQGADHFADKENETRRCSNAVSNLLHKCRPFASAFRNTENCFNHCSVKTNQLLISMKACPPALRPEIIISKSAVASPAVAVLVIEDEPEFAAVLSAILETEDGMTVRCAASIAEGRREFAAAGANIILLDLGLPDSNGLATLDAVHRLAPDSPIVVLTGADDEAMAIEAVRRGAQDYLVKTEIGTRTLVRGLRYALERHALQSQLSLHVAEIERRNSQMDEDLKLAREIQQSYLPRQRMTFPQAASPEDAALRFCFRYSPAEVVGGDFFSVIELSDSEVGVLICDVMGHGVSAALVSATVRGLIEEIKIDAADPSRFLGKMNRAIHRILRNAETPIFVTAFYMVADIRGGEVRYANAGHPAPLFIRPASRRVRSLRTPRGGAALGLFTHTQYTTCKKTLREGDLLMLFTDGLYEIEGADSESYGRERLPNDIRKRVKMTPAHLFDDLIEHIRDVSLNHCFDDDVCVVGMEVAHMGEKRCA